MKNTQKTVWLKQGMRILILSMTGLILISCSTKSGVPSIKLSRTDVETEEAAQLAPLVDFSSDPIKNLIMTDYQDWKGVPYRMGGGSKKGIDCSGFAHHVYNGLFNIEVPRSSRDFMNAGQKIYKDELKPGDLVVFFPPSYPRHVGVYVGDNKFIHASRNNGIEIADLDDPYWKRSYRMSRRIIVE